MPVTARLSRKFYEKLGDDLANELVEWFNMVDGPNWRRRSLSSRPGSNNDSPKWRSGLLAASSTSGSLKQPRRLPWCSPS